MAGNQLQFYIDKIDHIIDEFGLYDCTYYSGKKFFDELFAYIHILLISGEISEAVFCGLFEYLRDDCFKGFYRSHFVEPTHE